MASEGARVMKDRFRVLRNLSKVAQKVYAVQVISEGEANIDDTLYATREGAQRQVDWINCRNRYIYGRAKVVPMPLYSDEMAALRWGDEAEIDRLLRAREGKEESGG